MVVHMPSVLSIFEFVKLIYIFDCNDARHPTNL